MILKDKLKSIGRNYIVPTALAGAMALGGYGCKEEAKLPVNPETKEVIITKQNREFEAKQRKLDEMTRIYWSRLDSARSRFNEYIAQGDTLTVEKQEDIYGIYRSALDLRDEIVDYAKSKRMGSCSKLIFPKEHSKLYNLLCRNINDAEYGKTALETELRNSGMNILVEKKITTIDRVAPGVLGALSLYGLAGGIVGSIVGCYKLKNYVQRRRKKCRT